MQRTLTVIHALGLLLVVFSAAYLLPIVTAVVYADYTILLDFLVAMVWTLSIGFLMWLLTRRSKGELSIRHGYLLVVAMWTAMPMFATLPLLLAIPMTVVTSKVGVGTAMRAQNYLLIPEEVKSPAVLRRAWLHASVRQIPRLQAA